MNNGVIFTKGRKRRNEYRLPTLHFVVADNWIDTLGAEAFRAWLKFHTFVDRTNIERDYDLVPTSLQAVAKKIGVSKSKLYRLIRPLWEHGLIELVEYGEAQRKSQKPINIVVYDYPFNDKTRECEDLEKFRDWEKDYKTPAKLHGLKGGRPPKKGEEQEPETPSEQQSDYGFKNETVDGFKSETVDGFKNETVTVSEMKPNKESNISNKGSNGSSNVSNSSSKYLSILKRIKHADFMWNHLYKRIESETMSGHQLEDVVELYLNYIDAFPYQDDRQNDKAFIQVLSRVLNVKEIKTSFKMLLKSSIEREIKDIRQAITESEATRKEKGSSEVIPDWFNDRYKD